jgi:hypothetical protein
LAAFSDSLSFTQSVGFHGRGNSPSQGRYLHTGQHKQNKGTQTSVPQVGFEPTIAVFERAKTVHASDSAATAIARPTPGCINITFGLDEIPPPVDTLKQFRFSLYDELSFVDNQIHKVQLNQQQTR